MDSTYKDLRLRLTELHDEFLSIAASKDSGVEEKQVRIQSVLFYDRLATTKELIAKAKPNLSADELTKCVEIFRYLVTDTLDRLFTVDIDNV